jgi:nitrogen fixation NifU-like protein
MLDRRAYGPTLLDHFRYPRNVGALDKGDPRVGTGLVGTPAQGSVMTLQIRIDGRGVIEAARCRAYGCGASIAAISLASEWVKGKTPAEARQRASTEIAAALTLPPLKIHCAVLAGDAIKAAVADLEAKQARFEHGEVG